MKPNERSAVRFCDLKHDRQEQFTPTLQRAADLNSSSRLFFLTPPVASKAISCIAACYEIAGNDIPAGIHAAETHDNGAAVLFVHYARSVLRCGFFERAIIPGHRHPVDPEAGAFNTVHRIIGLEWCHQETRIVGQLARSWDGNGFQKRLTSLDLPQYGGTFVNSVYSGPGNSHSTRIFSWHRQFACIGLAQTFLDLSRYADRTNSLNPGPNNRPCRRQYRPGFVFSRPCE